MHPIEQHMITLGNKTETEFLMRFFKTAPGEYGEGDCFLGIRVPKTRALVKKYRVDANVDDVRELLDSKWHEVRLIGFLLLIEIYNSYKKRKDLANQRAIIEFYLSVIDRGNNWDLVDLVAPKILGDWLLDNPGEYDMLYNLAEMDGKLWHQRVAIVSTWTLIRSGQYDAALKISKRYLSHKHDLIHKATGWMLREIGKRGGMNELLQFLDSYTTIMPRTMLRYAIELFPKDLRLYYLNLK
ncbi:MAG: DNA alkylation repair protein [Muribaculaceae bacterium]|nr:DNA alkylation repair protein [Muribaculaceae bacterium]